MSGFPGGSPDALVTVDEIRAAAARLDGVIVATPLVPFPGTQPALLVKPESLQPVGSFKLRGAYAAISALPPAVRERGVVAHSSGNHAQAVAYAAALLGIPAVVVIPENAPEVKIAAVRRLRARIVSVQPTLAARVAATEDLISRHGYTLIPPFDHRAVIAGQGTIGLEIAAQRPGADLVVVPVGGGGLLSGVSAAIRGLCPSAKVIGVEPELAADARDSFRRRERVAWPPASTARTIADSLRVEQVGALPFEHILRYVDDIVTVTEDEIREAVRRIAVEAHLIAEPGGAVAVAACLLRRQDLPAARAPVAVLSGGNIDPGVLAGLLSRDGLVKLALGGIFYACHSRLLRSQDAAVRRRHRSHLSCGRARVAAAGPCTGGQRGRQLRAAVAPARRDGQVAGRLAARVPVPDRRGRAIRGRRLRSLARAGKRLPRCA